MYICKDCGWSSDNKQSYCAHRRIHSKNYKGAFGSTNTDGYICPGCGLKFEKSQQYGGHKSQCIQYQGNLLISSGINFTESMLIEFNSLDKIHKLAINHIESLNMLNNFENRLSVLMTRVKSYNSLLRPNNKYGGLIYKTLKLLLEIDGIKEEFIKYYSKYNLFQLSEKFNIDGKTLWLFYKYELGVKINPDKTSSKIHLQMKPWIEDELGYNTITEYQVGRYFIDEYCKELNLAIEIDGEWCHDKEYDAIRESIIKSKIGCKFIRINSKLDENSVRNIIRKFK